MYINTLSDSNDESFKLYKKRKNVKKFRTHLVSTRFLLILIKVMASDILINKRILANIKKFLAIVDRNYYSADDSIEAMLITCDLLLAIRQKNSVVGPNLETLIYKIQTSLQEPYDKIRDSLIIPQVQLAKDVLPEEDLEFIAEKLDQDLKYDYIYRAKDELADIATEISSCNYNDFPDLLLNFRDLVTDIMNFFRNTDTTSKNLEIVHTSDSSFLDLLKATYDTIMNPSSALKTGWQALNSALGPRGGFQNKNFYLFHANTNSFKSALLLHIARMISQYNSASVMEEYKRTGKIPTIVFIECENDDNEDYERLYKTIVKRDMDKCTSENELISTWKHLYYDKGTGVNSIGNIDISFIHVESRTLSVDGIDNLLDEIEEAGYHAITVIADYIALLAPRKEDVTKENRLQLKNIAEDLLSLAKRWDIPVISAHQLNRPGGAILTNIKNQGGSMAVSQMTNEFIGESYGIEQAASWSAFIDLETKNNNRYLTFKRNKSRFRNKYGCSTFVMPIRDGIIIDDDIYLDKPLSMDSIPGDAVDNSNLVNVGSRGTIDIRDKETVTEEYKKAKKNHELTIKPDGYKNDPIISDIINTLRMDNWVDHIDEFGIDELTYDAGTYDVNNVIYDTHRVGETEFCFSDSEECELSLERNFVLV